MRCVINHKVLTSSPYRLKYKWGATWQHIHMDDESEGDDKTYRPGPPPTWQHVNFSESANREGIIYPSTLRALLHIDSLWFWKTIETCHSVVGVINNAGLLCFVYLCVRESKDVWWFFTGDTWAPSFHLWEGRQLNKAQQGLCSSVICWKTPCCFKNGICSLLTWTLYHGGKGNYWNLMTKGESIKAQVSFLSL